MFKKYRFPLNLFLIFEKLNPVVYTSECLSINHYIIFIPKENYFSINKVFKNELFYSSSSLIEHSGIDTKYYDKLDNKFKLNFMGNRLMVFNTFYFYNIKVKITIFLNLFLSENIPSIESLYPNANWIERETSEMYCIQYTNKKDIRNLLLDYSRNEYPMLKEFPCEGYFDVYYDFFEDQLKYIESEFVEL